MPTATELAFLLSFFIYSRSRLCLCYALSKLPPRHKSAHQSVDLAMAAHRRSPNPKAAALLVIDVQNHFSSIAGPILPALAATIRLCRDAGIPVIYTRHRHRSPDDYGMLGEWWGDDLILDGTPASELMPEAGFRPGVDRVVEKSTYSAFQGTGLEKMLREEMGLEEVIVSGVMTNLCCETTARDAFVRNFRVFFSVDATATSSREMHEATLKNLSYGFTYLVDQHTLKDSLGN